MLRDFVDEYIYGLVLFFLKHSNAGKQNDIFNV